MSIESAHSAGPLRPIPIHLPRALPPHPPSMLDAFHFQSYQLMHSLAPSLASVCSSVAPDGKAITASRPRKPLWNPALDLTVTAAERSPRKADTAESLRLGSSGDPEATAQTSGVVSVVGKREEGESLASGKDTPISQRDASLANSAQSTAAGGLRLNKLTPPSSFPASSSLYSKTSTEKPVDTHYEPGTASRKRKQSPSSLHSPSDLPKPQKQQQDQDLRDKQDELRFPESKNSCQREVSDHRNHQHPYPGDEPVSVSAGGCVTTDSHTYQHFHHQRRLALLASNLLHMGAHSPASFIASPHHQLLPHLHNHPHQMACGSVLPPHPGLSLHNALALAKSREVLERLSASSSAFSNSSTPASASTCSHNPQQHVNTDHLPQVHQAQISLPQQRKQPQKECFPSASSSAPSAAPFLPLHPKSDKLQQPASLTLQNALVLAQSRALMERVGSGQMLTSPALTVDPLLPNQHHHHHHHHHNQPNILSPHGGAAAPIGAGGLIGSTVGLNMAAGTGGGGGYGRKLFPCPQCRYTTDRRNNLKRHMLTMHQTSSKMLECCGILFSTKASLREHAMIFHYHGYTCYFCGRRFCRKALLKRHLSVHNGQKDFVCTVCDYATSHKSNLERHRKVHSRQEGDEGREGEDGDIDTNGVCQHHYHDDMKSNGSEPASHDYVSEDELSVGSDYEDDIDVEINVHSD